MGACSSRDIDGDSSTGQPLSEKGPDDLGIRRLTQSLKHLSQLGQKYFSRTLRYNDSDIILFAYNGDVTSIKSALSKKEMPEILSIRGINKDIRLQSYFKETLSQATSATSLNESQSNVKLKLDQRLVSTKMWNPVIFAVFSNQLQMVKFLLSQYESSPKLNLFLSLTLNVFQKERQSLPDKSTSFNESLSLIIAISNRNVEMLSSLLSIKQIWKSNHIAIAIREIIMTDWSAHALTQVFDSPSFKLIIQQMKSAKQRVEYIIELFGSVFRDSDYDQDDSISSFDEQQTKQQADLSVSMKNNQQKWKLSVVKAFTQSDFTILLALFLIQKDLQNQSNTQYFDMLVDNLTEDKIQASAYLIKNKKDLQQLFSDESIYHKKARSIFEKLMKLVIDREYQELINDNNDAIQLLRLVKRGNYNEIVQNQNKYKPHLHQRNVDKLGELEFTETEQSLLFSLFQSDDNDQLKRLDPIKIAILYNQVNILQFFVDRWGITLRRKHIKYPDYQTNENHSNGLMIFEAAVKFRNYAMFKYLWDVHPHLFRIEDICEGTRIIIESRDNLLIKHILSSISTHYFFQVMSFSYKFTFIQQYIITPMKSVHHDAAQVSSNLPQGTNDSQVENQQPPIPQQTTQKQSNSVQDLEYQEYSLMISNELHKQPYSFFSFALFYEMGMMIECLKSLEQTTQRDITLFVKNNPKSAQRFMQEILQDEVALRLHSQFTKEQQEVDLTNLTYQENQQIKEREFKILENLKLFRESMHNFARLLQMELKLLDIKEINNQSSSNERINENIHNNSSNNLQNIQIAQNIQQNHNSDDSSKLQFHYQSYDTSRKTSEVKE
eukprot:403336932